MSYLADLFHLFMKLLTGFWANLPDDTKEKIKEEFINSFADIFAGYYDSES